MTETMFARAAAPRPNLGFAAILAILALVAGGFLLSTSTLPEPPPPAATAAPAGPPGPATVTSQS